MLIVSRDPILDCLAHVGARLGVSRPVEVGQVGWLYLEQAPQGPRIVVRDPVDGWRGGCGFGDSGALLDLLSPHHVFHAAPRTPATLPALPNPASALRDAFPVLAPLAGPRDVLVATEQGDAFRVWLVRPFSLGWVSFGEVVVARDGSCSAVDPVERRFEAVPSVSAARLATLADELADGADPSFPRR